MRARRGERNSHAARRHQCGQEVGELRREWQRGRDRVACDMEFARPDRAVAVRVAGLQQMPSRKLADPRRWRRGRHLGNVLEHYQFGEGGDRRRRHGEQRHEQHSPRDRTPLIGGRARHPTPDQQARQRSDAERHAEEQHGEIGLAQRAERLEERLGHWRRLGTGEGGRCRVRLHRRQARGDLGVMQRREGLAISELRRRQIG